MQKLFKKREVKQLPGKKAYYANGETPAEDQKENFKGKHYYSFACGLSVFTVHEDDAFMNDWLNSKVAEINLDITEAGAQFLNHANYADLIAEATFEGELDYARNRFKYQANAEQSVASFESKAVL
jgi:hypothetical protein